MTAELFREDGYLKHCDAIVVESGDGFFVTDQTVFYPAGGGQPGDRGWVSRGSGDRVEITDTVKDSASGALMHCLNPGENAPSVGEAVQLEIDWERRYRLMRMHSCMHMLCNLIDAPVTGGSISDGRGRLDFDLPEPVDKVQLNSELNRLIESNAPMSIRWITDDELDENPDLVRTMSVHPPRGQGRVRLVEFEGVDLQPCGGTHVASTGEIGRVVIKKIEKKGRQNRRVIVGFEEGADV